MGVAGGMRAAMMIGEIPRWQRSWSQVACPKYQYKMQSYSGNEAIYIDNTQAVMTVNPGQKNASSHTYMMHEEHQGDAN